MLMNWVKNPISQQEITSLTSVLRDFRVAKVCGNLMILWFSNQLKMPQPTVLAFLTKTYRILGDPEYTVLLFRKGTSSRNKTLLACQLALVVTMMLILEASERMLFWNSRRRVVGKGENRAKKARKREKMKKTI